jgi:hypothetical protein
MEIFLLDFYTIVAIMKRRKKQQMRQYHVSLFLILNVRLGNNDDIHKEWFSVENSRADYGFSRDGLRWSW